MNPTKRKLNALIQGIGAKSVERPSSAGNEASTASLAPNSWAYEASANVPMAATHAASSSAVPVSSITSEFLSKRRRVGVLGATAGNVNGAGGSLGKTAPSTSTSKKLTTKSDGGRSTRTAGELPRYCPSDREQLIARLSTFQELTEWTPKPDPVNEIEWAKRGWVCRGKERVRCTLCNKELVVGMNKREVEGKELAVIVGSEIEFALIQRFAQQIVEAHSDECLWRRRGCDDTLLRLSLTDPMTALPAVKARYDDLCSRPSFLPYIFNLRLPPTLSLDAVKSQLPPDFVVKPLPPSSASAASVSDVALALALTGWQGLTNPRIGSVPNSASCATCLRRLGLWMFKSKEIDPETYQVLIPALMDHLDPVREHRFFCPWRNPATQHNPGSKVSQIEEKTAWEVLTTTLRNAAYLSGRVRPAKADRSNHSRGHGRSQSSIVPSSQKYSPGDPETPSTLRLGTGMASGGEEDEAAREAEDKKRWARLRRVKSLFETKTGRKLRRTLSRPGTANSRPGTARSGARGGDGDVER